MKNTPENPVIRNFRKTADFKRLGDYIREVDVRNRELAVMRLLGVSISKEFIPSIANTIGTDMSSYKIVMRVQFAYGPVTSRNGDKVSIALLADDVPAIISQAYTVFEVSDKNKLLPEYLMMWFRRPEFDRYARYHSHGSAREVFDWEEMCDVRLPIPPLSRQREIVAEYETLTHRIRLNERLIASLESVAQTLYRRTFVDNIDPARLPSGWRTGTIVEMGEVITGKTPSTLDKDNFGTDVPFITIPDMHGRVFIHKTSRMLSQRGADSQRNKILPRDTICVSCIGTPGLVAITVQESQTNQQLNSIIPKEKCTVFYLYFSLLGMKKKISEYGTGAAVLNNLNKNAFQQLPIVIPDCRLILEFNSTVEPIFNYLRIVEREIHALMEMKALALSKIGRG